MRFAEERQDPVVAHLLDQALAEAFRSLPVNVKACSNTPKVCGIVVAVGVDADEPGVAQLGGRLGRELPPLLLQGRVRLKVLLSDAKLLRGAEEAHEKVGVTQPISCILLAGDISHGDFSIQRVCHVLQELGLNWHLMQQKAQVVVQLRVLSDQRGMALRVEAGAARAPKDLLHVQNAQVLEATSLGVEDRGALDDNAPCWQVDAPSQGGSAAEHRNHTSEEHLLGECSVRTEHSGMVDAKAVLKDHVHLLIPGLLHLLQEPVILLMRAHVEMAHVVLVLGELRQRLGRLEGVAPRVDKDHDLVSFSHLLHHCFIADLVELCDVLDAVRLCDAQE
mmetsp:Transcript_127324/g.302445  ORF Transcript_127324/g.302445 Transcript_127324/m.302445 type:complete len:335 (-) Transcript_127324:972-1976(-)